MKKEIPNGAKLAIPLLLFVVGFNAPMFLRFFIETDNTSILSTTTRIVFLSLTLFVLVPKVIGIPYRNTENSNLVAIGLSFKGVTWKAVVLGLLLGTISLTFMLIGSSITGGYQFDISRLEWSHIYFSFVPGLFEEVVFRGYLMVVAIITFKSFKKAAGFQILIFTLSHMKDFSGWGIVDMLTVSVIALAFTYVVLKTGSLFTAMIFHFIHDAFIFVVQKADGLESFIEHLVFYLFVWVGMVVIIVVTNIVSGKLKMNPRNLYVGHEIKNIQLQEVE